MAFPVFLRVAILEDFLLFLTAWVCSICDRCGVAVWPRWRIARNAHVVMRGHVEVADDVLAFGFDVHGPHGEVDFAAVGAGDDAFLGGATGFVTHALFKIGLVAEHDFLAGNLDFLAAAGGVLGHAGIGVGYRYSRRRGGILRGREADVGEGANRFAVRRLAGYLAAIGENIVSHVASPRSYNARRKPPAVHHHWHSETRRRPRAHTLSWRQPSPPSACKVPSRLRLPQYSPLDATSQIQA